MEATEVTVITMEADTADMEATGITMVEADMDSVDLRCD